LSGGRPPDKYLTSAFPLPAFSCWKFLRYFKLLAAHSYRHAYCSQRSHPFFAMYATEGRDTMGRNVALRTTERLPAKPPSFPDREALVNEFLPGIRYHASTLKLRLPPAGESSTRRPPSSASVAPCSTTSARWTGSPAPRDRTRTGSRTPTRGWRPSWPGLPGKRRSRRS